jgi:hypothetical protein
MKTTLKMLSDRVHMRRAGGSRRAIVPISQSHSRRGNWPFNQPKMPEGRSNCKAEFGDFIAAFCKEINQSIRFNIARRGKKRREEKAEQGPPRILLRQRRIKRFVNAVRRTQKAGGEERRDSNA